MTRRTLFSTLAMLWVLSLLLAMPALAINESTWQSTLLDSDCTDAKDTVPSSWGPTGTEPFVESTTGSGANGKCDHDNRILTGALTSSQSFTAITLPAGHMGMEIWVDADDVVADAGTWRIRLLVTKPHDDAAIVVQQFAEMSSEGNKAFVIYPHASIVWDGDTDALDGPLPRTFIVQLSLNTATSFAGDISWVSF